MASQQARPFPGLAGVQPRRGHLLHEALDRRRLVPEHHLAARVALEVRERAVVVVEGRVVEGEHERVEVAHPAQLVEDPAERGPLHLGRHERDHERHREPRRERLHAPLHLVRVPRHQQGDGGDRTELVEVAHVHLPAGPRRRGWRTAGGRWPRENGLERAALAIRPRAAVIIRRPLRGGRRLVDFADRWIDHASLSRPPGTTSTRRILLALAFVLVGAKLFGAARRAARPARRPRRAALRRPPRQPRPLRRAQPGRARGERDLRDPGRARRHPAALRGRPRVHPQGHDGGRAPRDRWWPWWGS